MERQPYPPPGSCLETVQGGGYGVKETTVVDGKQIIITICVNLLRFGKCCILRPYTFLANADDQKQLVGEDGASWRTGQDDESASRF